MKPANFFNDLRVFFSPRGQKRSNSFSEMYSSKFSSFQEKQCLFLYLVLIGHTFMLLVILTFHFGFLFFFFWTLHTVHNFCEVQSRRGVQIQHCWYRPEVNLEKYFEDSLPRYFSFLSSPCSVTTVYAICMQIIIES